MRKKRRRKVNPDFTIVIIFLGLMVLFKIKLYLIVIPLICFPASRALMKYFKNRSINQKYLNSNMSSVDQLDGIEFEYFLCTYFKELDKINNEKSKIEVTPKTRDFGADIVISKNGKRKVIQAKRSKNNVGIKAIQEVYGAREYYEADEAVVITSAHFTSSAIALAEKCNVALCDRDKLEKIMDQVQGKKIINNMKKTDDFKNLERKCPKCGANMVLRHGKYGDFWGCKNYPDCRYTKQF